VILWCVRWYVAYPISYRRLEEMMEERGVEVDHSTLNRWVVKYVPLLDQQFRARKRPVGSSWRMDEAYVKVKGRFSVKRVVRPMLGFKSFRSAASTIAGIELMHMIRKGQMCATGELRPAQQFYAAGGVNQFIVPCLSQPL
jgi:transposase-like protein